MKLIFFLLLMLGGWAPQTPAQTTPVPPATQSPTPPGKIFVTLEDAVKEPEAVGYLRLNDPRLQTFPPEIFSFPNLQSLAINQSRIALLPPEIGKLQKLTGLQICGGRLTNLPKEIGNLTNLQLLDLAGNRLTELPPEIGKLANLRDLNLGGNQLQALPAAIGHLTQLQVLQCNDNQILKLPPEIGKLTGLLILDASCNRLPALPPEVGNLTRLQVLDVHTNLLSEFPKTLIHLDNLLSLHAGFNVFSKLPLEIADLPKLQTVILDTSGIAEAEVDLLRAKFRPQTLFATTQEPYENGRTSGVGVETRAVRPPMLRMEKPSTPIPASPEAKKESPASDGPGQLPALKPRPVILSQVKPKYSETARQNYIQGKVMLSAEFRSDGKINKLRLLKSLGFGLDEAALWAALQIRFKPATIEGEPVSTRAKIEFTFNLI
ncbi:MAG: TonB family protein [Blastocatellia bacterium]|nr:TonB family protein [Blastocatellia bacterium]